MGDKERKHAAQRFEELAGRFDTLALREYTKLIHLAADLEQNTLPAARLLEEVVDAGLIKDGWPNHFVRSESPSVLRRLIGFRDEVERLCLLWTIAVGSWLQREYPSQLRDDAGEVPWLHYRATDEYHEAWTAYRKQLDAFVADLEAGRIPPGTEGPSFKAGDTVECVEETDYDDDDRLNRQRAKAQAFADACRLLARLVRREAVAGRGNGALISADDASNNRWEPPPGYVSSSDIMCDERFRKNGKNPARTTLQRWQEGHSVEIAKAPDTKESHYPETWVLDRIAEWAPRKSRD